MASVKAERIGVVALAVLVSALSAAMGASLGASAARAGASAAAAFLPDLGAATEPARLALLGGGDVAASASAGWLALAGLVWGVVVMACGAAAGWTLARQKVGQSSGAAKSSG